MDDCTQFLNELIQTDNYLVDRSANIYVLVIQQNYQFRLFWIIRKRDGGYLPRKDP